MSLAAIGPGFFPLIGRGVGAILLYAVLGVLLMLVGFWAIDLTTPGKLNRMVREGLPNAVLVTGAGHGQHGVHRGAGDLRLVRRRCSRACSRR